ncbi:MAG: hypothetical protein ACOC16_01680 [Nanoarchaeota archaeon]
MNYIINNKKGVELTLTKIITYIIAIIVLLFMIFFFLNHYLPNSEVMNNVSQISIDNAKDI